MDVHRWWVLFGRNDGIIDVGIIVVVGLKRTANSDREAAGVDGSTPRRLMETMEALGYELVDVLDSEHPSKVRLVFRTYPFHGGMGGTAEQLKQELFTTITYEDTMERPEP